MKEKYNWKEIYKKLDEGNSYQDMISEHGMAYATVCRKYKAYKAGQLQAMEENNTEEQMERLTIKEWNILIQQKKNNKIRVEANKMSNKFAVVDLLRDSLEGLDIKPIKIKKLSREVFKGRRQLFVPSDLHYLDSETSHSLNKMGQMFINGWDSSEIVDIEFNGDLAENTHHMEQLINGGNPMQQSVEVAQIIAKSIAEFKQYAGEDVRINVLFNKGNHDEIRQLAMKAGTTDDISIVSIVSELVKTTLSKIENIYVDTLSRMETILAYNFSSESKYITNFDKVSIRHGHVGLKSGKMENIENFIKNEHMNGSELKEFYIISHFHAFKHWIIKGSQTASGKDVNIIVTPSMKDWQGQFEIKNNLRNTSGMISINSKGQVLLIKIPK